jgi:hypothetical protein
MVEARHHVLGAEIHDGNDVQANGKTSSTAMAQGWRA